MPPDPIVVTGARGFIGSNLCVRLRERGHELFEVYRETPWDSAHAALRQSGAVFHVAGVNRTEDPDRFERDNVAFSARLAEAIAQSGKLPLVVFASSLMAQDETAYGTSKRRAEEALLALGTSARVSIWRLPNVFGKWARPNYNSAVATFCHNVARGLPIRIDNPDAPLELVHIDDLIDDWLALLERPPFESGYAVPRRTWRSTVGKVAAKIRAIAEDRRRSRVGAVGSGFDRALYATFMSYLPETEFQIPLAAHADARGCFAEVLKTTQSGQVSFLTASPGVTRGGHYHHGKVEKFVVLHGAARFRFRQVISGATHEIIVRASEPSVIETVPGWTHDITNIGDDELITLVWANEVFDPARPDTIPLPL
jgi:UDP-2-acetamido-2,6-beta-L-arabino-hexul-4-ose reductase